MDRVSLSVVVVDAIVAYSAIVVLGAIVVLSAIVVDARVFGVEGGDGDEIVVLLFVEEIVEDGAIVGVVESFEDLAILVVDGIDGVEGFVMSSRSPQSREALRDEASSRGLFAIEGIVEGGFVVARRSSK